MFINRKIKAWEIIILPIFSTQFYKKKKKSLFSLIGLLVWHEILLQIFDFLLSDWDLKNQKQTNLIISVNTVIFKLSRCSYLFQYKY